jgi:hypothetical protein
MDVNVEDDLFRYCYDYQDLLDNNISLKRYTQCECRPNNFGRKLLEMCKSNNLYIANSRIGKDKNIGKKTCNDLSVVDYLILSSNLFSVIKNFDALDYDTLFSDVHCALQFSFSVDICLLSAESRNISQPVNWDNCKKDEFIEYLTVNKNNEIKNIVNRLDNMPLLQDVSINDVNEIEKKVGNIFKHTSASVFGSKCKKPFCEKKTRLKISHGLT